LVAYWENQGVKGWDDLSGNGHDAQNVGIMHKVKVPSKTQDINKIAGLNEKTKSIPQRNLVDEDIEIDFLINEPDSPWADTLISINNSMDAYQLGDALSNPLFKKVLPDFTEKNFIFEAEQVSGDKLDRINRYAQSYGASAFNVSFGQSF
jgi:hypothetical protein